jgi:hypothetical protein
MSPNLLILIGVLCIASGAFLLYITRDPNPQPRDWTVVTLALATVLAYIDRYRYQERYGHRA